MTEPVPLHHALLLLMNDGARGVTEVDDITASYAFAGAIVGELQLRGRLVARAAHRFGLGTGTASAGALGLAEQRLARFEGSLKDAVSAVAGWTTGRLWSAAMEELVERGAVERAEDRLLGVRWRTRWPSADPAVTAALVDHLRAHVRRDAAEAPGWEDVLLSLARGSGILPTLWPDPDALALARPAVLRCTARAPLGREVRALVQEAGLAAGIAVVAGAT